MGDEREVSCVAGHHPTSNIDRFLAHVGEFGHSGYLSTSANLVFGGFLMDQRQRGVALYR